MRIPPRISSISASRRVGVEPNLVVVRERLRVDYAKGVKGEIDQRPRRFYQDVAVVQDADGWGVTLDGKAVRTAGAKPLSLPTQKLAEVVAAEWRAQVERIDMQSMFNTRLASTALDRAPVARAEFVAEAARYAETDLVCHLADAPAVLRDRQEAGWAPLREWASEAFGIRLVTVVGIIPQVQPPASLEAVRKHAASLDDFRLTGFVHGIPLFGSLVLGLAVERGRLSAAEAYELSRIDEAFQASRWGEDAEAIQRTERARAEARALDLWFGAL
jgi:chaperone required for assembly of F1-ATPase